MNEKTNKEGRINLIVGILTVLLVFALFTALIIGATVSKTAGTITTSGIVRQGSTETLTYTVNNKVKKGETISWYVDGEKIATEKYDGKPQQIDFTPTKAGATKVHVVAGKYSADKIIEVKKPLLTLSAKDVTMTYGEEIPQFQFECEGFINDDTAENVCANVHCETDCNGCVGVCKIYFVGEVDSRYEVQYNDGSLTVLPKEVKISRPFVMQYNQNNILLNPKIELSGVVEGDEVNAVADKIYFENKNVGKRKIVTANIQLEGKDSKNYKICAEAYGYITPRYVTLEGLTVVDKYYDGTTKAKISTMGTLNGVIDGDSVAIGNIDVNFDSADVGKRNVTASNVTLVGADKDNYCVSDVEIPDGMILDVN